MQFWQRLMGRLNWTKLKVRVLDWTEVKLGDWIQKKKKSVFGCVVKNFYIFI